MLGTATPLVGSGSATPVVWNAWPILLPWYCGSGPCFCSWFAKNLGLVVFTVSVAFHPSPVAWIREWLSFSAFFCFHFSWNVGFCSWNLWVAVKKQDGKGKKKRHRKRNKFWYCVRKARNGNPQQEGRHCICDSFAESYWTWVFLASTQSRTLIAIFFQWLRTNGTVLFIHRVNRFDLHWTYIGY